MEVPKALESSPLFRGIAPERIEELLARLGGVQRRYAAQELILREGETVRAVGILLSGSARSLKNDLTGRQVIVTLLEPGQYIGVLLAASQN